MSLPPGAAPQAANPPYRLPPPLFDARCKACWFSLGLLLLVVASFWTLDLQWAQFLSLDAARSMGRFLGEFFPPDRARVSGQGGWGRLETLAMSALGTVLAMAAGPAAGAAGQPLHAGDRPLARAPTRLLLNALRSIPELVWAALLLISAGLGPFAGTLALALHTTGVLGRLFAEAIENAPPGPGLRAARAGRGQAASSLRHAAAGAAAADELHAVPLGEQHPRRRGAGRGRRRRAGPDAGLPHGAVPHGQDQHHPGAMLLLVALVDALHSLRRAAPASGCSSATTGTRRASAACVTGPRSTTPASTSSPSPATRG
jgi:phosphonate transport system permease protein